MDGTQWSAVAEFEPQESVLLVWPEDEFSARGLNVYDVSAELVRHMAGEVEVVVCCSNAAVRARAATRLHAEGVAPDRVSFMVRATPIVYPRDFGADVLMDRETGRRAFVDFGFNEYDVLPKNAFVSLYPSLQGFARDHAAHCGIRERVETRLVSEGGDREYNGAGVMMAVLDTEWKKRNPSFRLEDLEAAFKRALDVRIILWLPQAMRDDDNMFDGPLPLRMPGGQPVYLCATANGHIDEFCRFVSADTVLLAQVSEEEAMHDGLHAQNKIRLDNARKALEEGAAKHGLQLRIVPMPVPETMIVPLEPDDAAYRPWLEYKRAFHGLMKDGSPFLEGVAHTLPALSYCNFLILNNLVLSQKYYRPGLPEAIRLKDEQAARTLAEVFPGKKIVSVHTLALNLLGGGIHCHTRNIPSNALERLCPSKAHGKGHDVP